MAKVFIGVGHGGKDPGAVANGFKEKELNLDVADAVFQELERHGVYARLSRVGDENDTLADRIRDCNEYAPDLALDIHHNAGGGDGAETFYHYKGGASKTLAENVLSEIVLIGQNSRGAKIKKGADGRDYYGFIRETKAPAVIVECAFLDNQNDVQIVDSIAERRAMGVAIAKGVLKTLGITYFAPMPESTPKPEAAPAPKQETEEILSSGTEMKAWKQSFLEKFAAFVEKFLEEAAAEL